MMPCGSGAARNAVLALGATGALMYGVEEGELLCMLAWAPARPPVALVTLAPGRWLVGDAQVCAPTKDCTLPDAGVVCCTACLVARLLAGEQMPRWASFWK